MSRRIVIGSGRDRLEAEVVWSGTETPPWASEPGALLRDRAEASSLTSFRRLMPLTPDDEGAPSDLPREKLVNLRDRLWRRLQDHFLTHPLDAGTCGCGCGALLGLNGNGRRRYLDASHHRRNTTTLRHLCRQHGITLTPKRTVAA